jgi:hypothetical protein
MPSAAGGQAQHAPTANVAAEPSGRINRRQRALQLVISRRRRQRRAFAHKRIPSPSIVRQVPAFGLVA